MVPVKQIKEENIIDLKEELLDLYESDSSIECLDVVTKLLPQKRLKPTIYKSEG